LAPPGKKSSKERGAPGFRIELSDRGVEALVGAAAFAGELAKKRRK
jgi:hypothetical protein